MTTPNRGCRLRPDGPLIAADLRKLVARMDELNLSDYADVEITTPIAGDRRAATITVIEYPQGRIESAGPPPQAPAEPGDEETAHTESDAAHG